MSDQDSPLVQGRVQGQVTQRLGSCFKVVLFVHFWHRVLGKKEQLSNLKTSQTQIPCSEFRVIRSPVNRHVQGVLLFSQAMLRSIQRGKTAPGRALLFKRICRHKSMTVCGEKKWPRLQSFAKGSHVVRKI